MTRPLARLLVGPVVLLGWLGTASVTRGDDGGAADAGAADMGVADAGAADAGAADEGVIDAPVDESDEPSCGDLMFVFDRSGSMFFCSIDGKTKESIAIDALGSVIGMNRKVPMGLTVFPDTVKLCGFTTGCAKGTVAVDVSADGSRLVPDYLRSMPTSCGGTPTGDTMLVVRDYTGWTPGKRHYVVLMTDGQPTCQDDNEGKCNGAGHSECAMPTKAFEAVKTLAERGVHTFVVGFEGMATWTGSTDECEKPFNPETLNKLAELGGEAQVGATKYYSATSEATLFDALKRISERVVGSTAGCGPTGGDAGSGAGDGGTGDGAAGQDGSGQDADKSGHGGGGGCGCRIGGRAGPEPSRRAPALACLALAALGLRRRSPTRRR